RRQGHQRRGARDRVRQRADVRRLAAADVRPGAGCTRSGAGRAPAAHRDPRARLHGGRRRARRPDRRQLVTQITGMARGFQFRGASRSTNRSGLSSLRAEGERGTIMSTSRPRLVCLGAALAAVAACGGSDKGQATTPVMSSTEPTEPTEPAGPDKTQDPVQPTEPVKPAEPPPPAYLHGKLVWFELVTSDPAKSKAFHADLLGWTVEPQEMAGMKYELAKAGGKEVATLRAGDDKKVKSHWVPFVSVPDVDAAVAAVEKNKGKVVKAAVDVPDVGRFAIVSD